MLDLYFFVWMEKVLTLALHVEVLTKLYFLELLTMSGQLQQESHYCIFKVEPQELYFHFLFNVHVAGAY